MFAEERRKVHWRELFAKLLPPRTPPSWLRCQEVADGVTQQELKERAAKVTALVPPKPYVAEPKPERKPLPARKATVAQRKDGRPYH